MNRIRIPEIKQDETFFKYQDRVKVNLERLKKARDNNIEYDAVKDIAALFNEEPFFARFSSYIKKVENWDLPFAAKISFNRVSTRYWIEYNPFFFLQLNKEQRKAIWGHEFFHMILEHIGFRWDDDKFANWASDMAINSMRVFIEQMKEMLFIFPDGHISFSICAGVGPFAEFLPEKSYEEYLGLLRKKSKDLLKEMRGFDDHSFMESVGEGSGKILEKTILRDILNNAKNGVNGDWGTMGQTIKPHVVDLVDVALKPESVFKYFVSTLMASCNHRSWTKVNRRKRYIRPGKMCERICNLAILVDESGSVNDELLGKCSSWMNDLAEFTNFWVIPHDAIVDENFVFEWKQGEKIQFERKLQGGTCFDAPLSYIKQSGLNIDGAVFITDLQAPLPISNDIPRIWITSQDYQTPTEFGNEVVLRID